MKIEKKENLEISLTKKEQLCKQLDNVNRAVEKALYQKVNNLKKTKPYAKTACNYFKVNNSYPAMSRTCFDKKSLKTKTVDDFRQLIYLYSCFGAGMMYKSGNRFTIHRQKNIQENIVSLCVQYDLDFNDKQLAEIVYFVNEFPFSVSEYSTYVSSYDENYTIFEDFFDILAFPNYRKNNLGTKNKEEYVIKIVRMFNSLPRLYMSLEEYEEFLSTFYFVDNVSIFHTISVLFGDKINNSEWRDDWEEEALFNRPKENEYFEVLKELDL